MRFFLFILFFLAGFNIYAQQDSSVSKNSLSISGLFINNRILDSSPDKNDIKIGNINTGGAMINYGRDFNSSFGIILGTGVITRGFNVLESSYTFYNKGQSYTEIYKGPSESVCLSGRLGLKISLNSFRKKTLSYIGSIVYNHSIKAIHDNHVYYDNSTYKVLFSNSIVWQYKINKRYVLDVFAQYDYGVKKQEYRQLGPVYGVGKISYSSIVGGVSFGFLW